MTKLLVFGLIALFSSLGMAHITGEQEYLLNHAPASSARVQLGTLLNKTTNLLVAKYSFAVQGGTTANDLSLLTDLTNPTSYAKLPNKAIITNVWLEVLTQPTSGGSATVALKSKTAADLLAATAIASLPVAFKQGVPTGATTTFIKMTAETTIKATVAVATLTAGKFNVYIEYVLGD